MISRHTSLQNTNIRTLKQRGSVIRPQEFNRISGRFGADDFNPIALSLSDQMSAKQIAIARVLARRVCVDVNEIAEDLFDCEFLELSKSAAERLISLLRTTASEMRAGLNIRLAG